MCKGWLARLGLASMLGLASGMLSGCMAMDDMEQPMAVPVCPTETRGWEAWINAMPGPDAQRTLIVMGEALLPEDATATLSEGPLDRMMPPGQRIALAVERSDRAAGWQKLRIEIPTAQSAYSSVLIGCDGNEVARITDIVTAQ